MKKNILSFISGALATAMILTAPMVYAETSKTIEAISGKINVVIDNKKIDNESLLYEGRTYLQVRSLGEALGKEVYFDSATDTAYLDPAGTNRGNTATAEPHADWSYSGATGPAYWGDINPDYALAKTGKQQSPINIIEGDAKKADKAIDVQYHYVPTSFELENNGHAIEAIPEGNENYIVVDGETYYLAQFHIHSASEHAINGKQADMEIHFVNKTKDGKIAVVGVLVDAGNKNEVLAELFDKAPAHYTSEEDMVKLDKEINIMDFLPKDSSIYRYDGSLTTPPATEGVKWIVYNTKAQISQEQLSKFNEIYKGNFRPVQPLNGRIVTQY